MAIAAMNMVSAGRFSGVSFHLRTCPQGVASVLCKKTPILPDGMYTIHSASEFPVHPVGKYTAVYSVSKYPSYLSVDCQK